MDLLYTNGRLSPLPHPLPPRNTEEDESTPDYLERLGYTAGAFTLGQPDGLTLGTVQRAGRLSLDIWRHDGQSAAAYPFIGHLIVDSTYPEDNLIAFFNIGDVLNFGSQYGPVFATHSQTVLNDQLSQAVSILGGILEKMPD